MHHGALNIPPVSYMSPLHSRVPECRASRSRLAAAEEALHDARRRITLLSKKWWQRNGACKSRFVAVLWRREAGYVRVVFKRAVEPRQKKCAVEM